MSLRRYANNVTFFPCQFQMIATIKLFVTNDLAQLTKTDFEACAPRFSDDRYTKTFFGKSAASVDCGTSGVHDLTPGGSSLVRHGWFCSNEYIMKNVEGTHKCGKYH